MSWSQGLMEIALHWPAESFLFHWETQSGGIILLYFFFFPPFLYFVSCLKIDANYVLTTGFKGLRGWVYQRLFMEEQEEKKT